LLIETRRAERIDAERIDVQMPSHGRCRELRHGYHFQLVFQIRFEGVE
jgi:hypothetical protein